MKKVLLALSLVLVAGSASAQHFGHHGHHGHGGYRGSWGLGYVLGGAIAGAVIYDIYNRPVVVQQPPVIVQQPQSVIVQRQSVCTEWKEIQQPDGTIYRERSCYGPQPIVNQ
jgi:hypothetical protein